MVIEPVVDTIEAKWNDLREFVDSMEGLIAFYGADGEKIADARQGLRLHASLLVAEGERLGSALPTEAEAFVRKYLGEPPFPSWREVMIETHPELREAFEKGPGQAP